MFYLFRVSLANIKPASQKKALKKIRKHANTF